MGSKSLFQLNPDLHQFCAGNGWIHVYKGLCWVRDNTKIKIPDSAWEGVAIPSDVEEAA